MLSDEALKRLRVLQREAGLGAGFNLAKSDLQIRGAGTVLGTAQKGAYGGVSGIGADMYMTILQVRIRRAISARSRRSLGAACMHWRRRYPGRISVASRLCARRVRWSRCASGKREARRGRSRRRSC